MPLFQGLGRALRWLRDSQGKRQYQVADAAGITKAMLSAYETGKQKPSLDTLERLLEALECDLADLDRALQIAHEQRGGWALPPGGAPASPGGAVTSRPPGPPEAGLGSVSELARLIGLGGPIAKEEERALAEMMQGFVRLLRFLHGRVAAATAAAELEEPASRR